MKNIIGTTFFCLLINLLPLQAQEYSNGIGLRFSGYSGGITYRGFLNGPGAIEGIASFGHRSFMITGLYEKFRPVRNATGLYWFYGIGAHAGFFRSGGSYYIYKSKGEHVYAGPTGGTRFVPGIDFIIGLDYTFPSTPINLGLDIKPFFDIVDGTHFYFDGALSVRFVF
jgi:hypothetical protein